MRIYDIVNTKGFGWWAIAETPTAAEAIARARRHIKTKALAIHDVTDTILESRGGTSAAELLESGKTGHVVLNMAGLTLAQIMAGEEAPPGVWAFA